MHKKFIFIQIYYKKRTTFSEYSTFLRLFKDLRDLYLHSLKACLPLLLPQV